MNPSTTALTLNLQLPNIATVSWAVQGDQLSRVITATLLDGSTAWTPQAAYHGVMRFHKPDGTSGVYDVDEDGNPAVTWSGNVATIKIVQQALTVPGSVMMQLEFYDSNSARVSAFGWVNNVQPSAVTDNEFLSADYYNILTLQIAAVLGAETHPPYIDDTTHDWMVWDTTVNDYVDSGVYAIGPVGPPPTVTATGNQYANSASGTTPPSSWSDTRPAPVQGQWSWTKTTVVFDTGTSTFYTAAYQGIDGSGNPGTATPIMDGTAAVGTSSQWAHEDHVHPSDTSKVSKAGDTMSGTLRITNNTSVSNTQINLTDGTDITATASSNVSGNSIYLTDKNGVRYGGIAARKLTDDKHGMWFFAVRPDNGNSVGAEFYYDSNNNRSVVLTPPDAWRSALGLGSVETGESGANLFDVASGFTLTEATCYKWGHVVNINLNITKTTEVTTPTFFTLGTIKVANKRPITVAMAGSTDKALVNAYVLISGQVNCNVTSWAANTSKRIMATYLSN